MKAFLLLLPIASVSSTFMFGQPSDVNASAESGAEPSPISVNTSNAEIETLFHQAAIYSEQGNYAAAFNAYDSIIQTTPDNAEAWSGRGLAAFKMEAFSEALNSFEKAVAKKPNGLFLQSLAWTYLCSGKYNQATEAAQKASLIYGQNGKSAVYPLLIAYFSYLKANDINSAGRTLAYMLLNMSNYKWPQPVVLYLSGKIPAAELISFVTNLSQETEAHTYIGMKLNIEGKLEDSKRHLEWVSRKGDSQLFQYTVAKVLNLQNNVVILDDSQSQ